VTARAEPVCAAPPVRRFRRSLRLVPGLVLVLALCGVTSAQAQETVAGRLIAQARQQIEDINPDSAAVLLRQALDPRSGATLAEKLRAFVLYGVTELTASRADGARRAFREALALDPTLSVDSLAELHEALVLAFTGERSALEAAARPAPGILELRGLPAGARVAVDGVAWTDRRRELPSGVHRIEVTARGHFPYLDSVKVDPGVTLIRDVAMVRSDLARLSVGSVPWGTVYLDTERVGETPLFELQVPAGSYSLRVTSPDRAQPFVQTVELAPGRATRVVVPGGEPSVALPPRLSRADSLFHALNLDSALALYREVVWDTAGRVPSRLRAQAATRVATAFLAMASGRKQAALADSARLYFGMAYRDVPLYEPDLDELGPEAQAAMDSARMRVLGIVVNAPADTMLPATGGRLPIEVQPTHMAMVSFRVTREDGQTIRSDSQQTEVEARFEWDYHLPDGSLLPGGRYSTVVTARDAQGLASPTVVRPFTVAREPVDTLPHPAQPSAAAFLPETVQVRGASAGVLLGGVALGAGTLALERVLGNSALRTGSGSGAGSYAVAGGVSLVAVVGFLAGHRTRAAPENTAHNAGLRGQFQRDRAAAVTENVRRRENARVRFRFDEAP